MSHKACEGKVVHMSAAIVSEMQAGLRTIAEPVHAGESVKALINKAARRTGFEYWRAREIWYGRARRIDASELEIVRACLRKQEKASLNAEMAAMHARVSRLEALFTTQDPEFFGPDVSAVREQLAQLGRVLERE